MTEAEISQRVVTKGTREFPELCTRHKMDSLKYRDISDFQICLKNRSFQRLDGVGTVRYSRLGSSLVRMMKPAAWPMCKESMFSSTPGMRRLPLIVTIDVLLLTLEACSLAYVHRKHVPQCPKGGEITIKRHY
ncbi:hypothetical protein J6590_106106 [Homalodisca vitripennis]|nr:hypothetical protein J6590_106106 [Homalodisca vitripennis]